MDKAASSVEDYYIIFTGSTHNHWLIKRLRKPFQHVFAVKKSPGGRFWIIINPLITHTHIDIIAVSQFPTIGTLLIDPESSVVIPVTATITAKERHTLCIFNCVEVVKSLLGMRAFWIWTPYQLYKRLKKGGTNERDTEFRGNKKVWKVNRSR